MDGCGAIVLRFADQVQQVVRLTRGDTGLFGQGALLRKMSRLKSK